MKNIFLLALLGAVLSLSACGENTNRQENQTTAGNTEDTNVGISGVFSGLQPNTQFFLERWNFEQMESVGGFKLGEANKMDYRFLVKEPGVYRLRAEMNVIWLLLEGGENLDIQASIGADGILNYTIKGSALTDELQPWLRNNDVAAAGEYVATAPKEKALLKLILTGRLPIAEHIEALKTLGENLEAQYPGSKITVEYTKRLQQMEVLASRGSVAKGKPVPEIKLPDPYGKSISLSELKGKVVLIDFWASWCGPCRRENPNVVRIYNKYKDKGFAIYSVSLDGLDDRQQLSLQGNPDALQQNIEVKRQAWIQAIKDDGLIWKHHVSELRSWSSNVAQLYSVESIPQTFLLDREGNLRYTNLRGAELEAKIAELL